MDAIKEYRGNENDPHKIITIHSLCRVLAWIRPRVEELLVSAACLQGLSPPSQGGLYLRCFISLSFGQPQRLGLNTPLFF